MCRTLLSCAAITNNLRVTAKGSVEQYSSFLLSEKGSSAIKGGSKTSIFFWKKRRRQPCKAAAVYLFWPNENHRGVEGQYAIFGQKNFVSSAKVCFTHRLDKWLNESFPIFSFLFCSAALVLSSAAELYFSTAFSPKDWAPFGFVLEGFQNVCKDPGDNSIVEWPWV